MPYEALPAELRQLPQWVLVKVFPDGTKPGKTIKEPYQLNGLHHASVTDPSTWSTFSSVAAAHAQGIANHIGFVFTDRDHYTGIDLDASDDPAIIEFQKRIFDMFPTYAERSQSGRGLHLICRGKIPYGRRRNGVEVYSTKRYFVMTGDVYRQAPIVDCQNQLDWLMNELGGPPQILSHDGNAPQTQEDQQIFETAKDAENGAKFLALWQGQWQDLDYPSQSEADFALYDIIAFYTKNAEQIRRMFMSSALGDRPKALRDDYHAYMLRRVFDRDIPPIDLEGMEIAAQIALDKHKEKAQGENAPLPASAVIVEQAPVVPAQADTKAAGAPFKRNPKPYSLPPGLVGKIAQYVYDTAPRQVEEIALAAAIGLMAGICGRAYNVSNSGLNLYLLVLAETGHGKEAMASGIDALLNAVETECPAINDFRGPSMIASGQAIVQALAEHPCFVSIIGEFGYKFQAMSADKASIADLTLNATMLDLYSKSGSTRKLGAARWADIKKKIDALPSPAFSLICESVPSIFYKSVSEKTISNGLLPRFIIIDSKKSRQYYNENSEFPPPIDLQNGIVGLASHCLELAHKKQTIHVQIAPEVRDRVRSLDTFTTDEINATKSDITQHLWNRVHLNTLRLAALVAIGINHIMPTITSELFEWASDVVIHSTYGLFDRFEAGDIGESENSEHAQSKVVEKVIREFFLKDYKEIGKSYSVTPEAHAAKVIPYSFLQPILTKHPAFYRAEGLLRGTRGILSTLERMCEIGVLVKLTAKVAGEKYKLKSTAYMISDFAAFGLD